VTNAHTHSCDDTKEMQRIQQKELETKKLKNKLRFMSVHRHIKIYINQTDTKGKIVQNTDSERVFWPAKVATLPVQLALLSCWELETLKSLPLIEMGS